eukprot:51207_1
MSIIIAHVSFLLTGPPMVLLHQKETYIGGNYPWSFLSNIAQYTAMTSFAVIPLLIDSFKRDPNRIPTRRPLLQLSLLKLKYIFPIALCDVMDVCASAYAYQAVGASMFIVIYSSVTIFTGLIRKIFLQKDLTTLQWIAVIIITIGLAIISVDSELNEFNITLVFGMFATLISACMDASMYVFSERALDVRHNKEMDLVITEWDITVGVGLIGLCLSVMYICMYSIAGQFNNFVIAPMKVNYELIVLYWSIEGVVVATHYIGFYYVVALSSSVTAAVNKAVQSAFCFAAASMVFCSDHHSQCFTWIMAVSALIVNTGTVLYAYGKRKDKRNVRYGSEELNASLQEK